MELNIKKIPNSQKKIVGWILDYAAQNNLEMLVQAVKNQFGEADNFFDKDVCSKVTLNGILGIIEGEQFESSKKTIETLREIFSADERIEKLIQQLKIHILVHQITKNPKGTLELNLLEESDNTLKKEIKNLHNKVINSGVSSAQKMISQIFKKYDLESFKEKIISFLKEKKDSYGVPFLEVVEQDICKGKYVPSEQTILSYHDISDAWEGGEEEWSEVYNQTHPDVKNFLKEKNHEVEFIEESQKKPKKSGRSKTTVRTTNGSQTRKCKIKEINIIKPSPNKSGEKEQTNQQLEELRSQSDQLLNYGVDPLGSALRSSTTRRHSSSEIISQNQKKQKLNPKIEVEEEKEETTLVSTKKIKKETLPLAPKPFRIRRRWNQEEEERLLKGIAEHGIHKWSQIKASQNFTDRTSVDLKDKWRNLSKNNEDQVWKRIAKYTTGFDDEEEEEEDIKDEIQMVEKIEEIDFENEEKPQIKDEE